MHAQRVICTHLMLTPTPSLPLPAVSLCMCRHGSAAVMPCGCDCTHWRCWWLPLPSHFFFLLPFQLLCCFITRCVGSVCGEGEGDACFTQPHHRPLANNCRLVVACLCWWLRGGGCVTVRVAAPHPPPPRAMLCCLLVPAWHVLLTPSRIRTFVFATWARHRLQSGRSRQVCLCVVRAASSCCWCCDMHCVVV